MFEPDSGSGAHALDFMWEEFNMANPRGKYFKIIEDHFPPEMSIAFGEEVLRYRKRTWQIQDKETGESVERGLRYGENPDQEAALYELVEGDVDLGKLHFIGAGRGLVSALDVEDMIQVGKHPGKTNLTDVDNAVNILRHLTDMPCVCIMKHNNPCGAARAESLLEAYERAYMADRLAAMGGAVVMNRPVDMATADMMSHTYVEVVAAPAYESGTIATLRRRKNLRILRIPGIQALGEYQKSQMVDFKCLMDGGIIVQVSQRNRIRDKNDLRPAIASHRGREYRIERMPSKQEYDDMVFGWALQLGISSNSVIFVKRGVTVAIGTGEQDRVGCAEIAVHKAYTKFADALSHRRYGIPYWELVDAIRLGKRKAEEKDEIDREAAEKKAGLIGSVMISDGFFPFRDGVMVGVREGVAAVLQPGGSMRDHDVIQACNEADPPVAMMFTGQRAFKH